MLGPRMSLSLIRFLATMRRRVFFLLVFVFGAKRILGHEEMTIEEIMLGKGNYYPGLVPLVYAYLGHIGCDADTMDTVDQVNAKLKFAFFWNTGVRAGDTTRSLKRRVCYNSRRGYSNLVDASFEWSDRCVAWCSTAIGGHGQHITMSRRCQGVLRTPILYPVSFAPLTQPRVRLWCDST